MNLPLYSIPERRDTEPPRVKPMKDRLRWLTHWVTVRANKPDDLCSLPELRWSRKKTDLCKMSSDLHKHINIYTYILIHFI